MSTYTFLYGINPEYLEILKDIKVIGSNLNIDAPTYTQIPRFRDVYYKNGVATILSRIGGKNKKEYIAVFENIVNNPNYIETIEFKTEDNYVLFNFRCKQEFKRYYLVRKIFTNQFEINHQTKEQFDLMKNIIGKIYSNQKLNEEELRRCPYNIIKQDDIRKDDSSVIAILDRENILEVLQANHDIIKHHGGNVV
jgi:hypothetical protein